MTTFPTTSIFPKSFNADFWDKTISSSPRLKPAASPRLNSLKKTLSTKRISYDDAAAPAATLFFSLSKLVDEDISEKCKHIHSLILDKKIEEANKLLPLENIYPLPDNLKTQILYSE